MKLFLTFIISLFLTSNIFAQPSMRSKKNELIRQYTFKSFSLADSKSDSIRILSYLIVPNNVLKFIKKDVTFESSYQAKITIKKKRGEQIGRKS